MTIVATDLLFTGYGRLILLVIVQAVLKVFGSNRLVVTRYLDRPDDIKNMGDESWCKGDIAINWPTTFVLVQLHRHTSSGWEVPGEVGVAYTPVAKVHPAIRWRRIATNGCPVLSIIEQRHIGQAERRHTPILDCQDTILT